MSGEVRERRSKLPKEAYDDCDLYLAIQKYKSTLAEDSECRVRFNRAPRGAKEWLCYSRWCRCDIGDAKKVYSLAAKRGVTMSVFVAQLIHKAVARAKITPDAERWASEVLAKNAARRQKADERVRSGADRKPGWENTPKWRKILGNERKGG